MVPAPFSRFFIANTLHHRLRAGSLAIARQLYDWSLALRASRVTGENLVVHWRLGARWPEHISGSLSRIAGEGWGEGVPQ